jgi:hypothetical protein
MRESPFFFQYASGVALGYFAQQQWSKAAEFAETANVASPEWTNRMGCNVRRERCPGQFQFSRKLVFDAMRIMPAHVRKLASVIHANSQSPTQRRNFFASARFGTSLAISVRNLGLGDIGRIWRVRLCPLLAQSRHWAVTRRCPLLGVKRTWRFQSVMSAFDPKRKSSGRICRDAHGLPPAPVVVGCSSSV